MSDYKCRRCGHPYGWRGGISFGAVCELGRLIREHDAESHHEVDSKNPTTDLWAKRNTSSGHFEAVKRSGDVFKGVRREN